MQGRVPNVSQLNKIAIHIHELTSL